MGKDLIQQRRGKGSKRFQAPSHRYKAAVHHVPKNAYEKTLKGEVKDIVHCPGHTCPLAVVEYENNLAYHMLAPAGISVGDVIEVGEQAQLKVGSTMPLGNIPEGTIVYNLENQPGDGGKFARSSGAAARVVAKFEDKVVVQLPSKTKKDFNPECRATVGVVSGAGRKEKPFYKAGRRYHERKARGKTWPKVTAQAMNAIDHPYGGSRTSRKGRPTIAPRNAPPGRKVGMIRPRRTGRKKK